MVKAKILFNTRKIMEFSELFGNYVQTGRVTYILIRPLRLVHVEILSEVIAIKDKGLEGDRYKNTGGGRQVTLTQAEHLKAVASFLGHEHVDPSSTRRNIVVEGINLLSLKDKIFHIGDAILKYSGECHPCSRMEKSLGLGGYNAMRGHGGVSSPYNWATRSFLFSL
jgi:hypothetical protein